MAKYPTPPTRKGAPSPRAKFATPKSSVGKAPKPGKKFPTARSTMRSVPRGI